FLTGRGLSLTEVRHLKSPASPITLTRNAAFGSGAGLGRRGTAYHLQGICQKCKTICRLPVARICHLAYLAIRRREGTDPWSVGTTSARPSGHHARSRTAPFFSYDACAPRLFGGGIHLSSRPFALGWRISCLQNGDWQNIEQVCRRQAWPSHRFADRQHGAHGGKTFGQHRCIPGLSGRPSPAALRRATKQPAGHDDNGVLLAEPCERDDLVAVRADDSERTIGAVGKDVWKLLSQ